MFRLFKRVPDLYDREPLRVEDGIPVFSASDRYTENYERIAGDHLGAMRQGIENPFIDKNLWAALEDSTRALIRERVPQGARVLDVGVGLGRLLGPLDGYVRYGIDISAGYLKEARAAGIEVALARIEDMPYKPESFDTVVCCDVLEHVLDLYACTGKILDTIRPGGLLIVRVPYMEDLSGYTDPANPYEFVHLRNFDLDSLRLHFTRIFSCEWIEHRFAAHYFTNHTRLVLRLPPADSPLHAYLRGIPRFGHPLSPLIPLCGATEGDLFNWLKGVERDHPEAFEEVRRNLVLPLEVKVVLRKGP